MKKFLFALSFVALIGCGHKQIPQNNNPIQSPAWVTKGGGAFIGDFGKVFYGVGIAPKMYDISLQRDMAENRAARQILKSIHQHIAYMMKDYTRDTLGDKTGDSAYEGDVARVQKTVTVGNLNGVQVIDIWKDPSDGTLYSLAVLDFKKVANVIAEKKELDSKLRDFVRNNFEKAFDDLALEEAKVK
jgi:hypothetical protein